MRRYLEWLGVGVIALFIAVNQLVFRANLDGENLPGLPTWLVIGSFLLFVMIWLLGFVRSFKIVR